MATNTTKFNFKKPDESDFYSIQDQNGNWDKVDAALDDLNNPGFEDYTGSATVPSAAVALEAMKTKRKIGTLFSNIKAFCKGCCTLAMIVDNCVTNRGDLPGSARQLKVLMDLFTQLNSDMASTNIVASVNDAAINNYILNVKKSGKVVTISGNINVKSPGTGLRLANIQDNFPVFNISFPLSSYSALGGTGRIDTSGYLLFDLPEANKDYYFSFSYCK